MLAGASTITGGPKQYRIKWRKMLPTLTAHDVRGGAKPERTALMWESSARGCDLPSMLRLVHPESTGIINPSWAEGFMGYAIGWTELEP